MDQRLIAGLGNIYVCEALFRAGLHPEAPAGSLATSTGKPRAKAHRLAEAVRDVLTEAVAAGGSTLRDYAQTDGSLGYFQHSFRVYDREGEACSMPGCGGAVRRLVQGGFRSRDVVHDGLLIALVETGVPVWALDASGVESESLGIRVAGGLIISTVGFRMLFPAPPPADTGPRGDIDIAFTPIAMPSLAGPGSISVVLSAAAHIKSIRPEDWQLIYVAVILGMANKLLESWSGAVLEKIAVLVFISFFIQRRPQGMFALRGRAVET